MVASKDREMCCSKHSELFIPQLVQYVAGQGMLTTMLTCDGSDTYHGRRMIAIATPRNKNTNLILKVKVTLKDKAAVRRVPVYYHKEE